MATVVVNNTTWEPEVAGKMYSETILGGKSRQNFRKILNIKSEAKVAIINTNAEPLQEADCEFSPNGTITLGEKKPTVCDFKINMEVCVKDFYSTWLEANLAAGNADGESIPMESLILDEILKRASLQLEYLTWRGDTGASSNNLCDGMIKKLEADSDVLDQTIDAITASNVIAELTKIYNKAATSAEQVLFQLNGAEQLAMKFYVPANVIAAYKVAQATVATQTGAYFLDDKALNFLGHEMIYAPGLPSNTIVFANPENLWLITDLESDIESLEVIPQKNVGKPTVIIVGGFKFGVDFGVGAEIVLAQTA